MEQLPRLSLLLVVAVLGFIDSGYSFLYRREEDNDSPDKVAHLQSRYWNDDIQPCIEKYCLPYVSAQHVYVQCLQAYCPAGLLAVPRDTSHTDSAELFPATKFLGQTQLCSDDFVDNIPEFNPICTGDKCPFQTLLKQEMSDEQLVRIFQYGVYNLCRVSFCSRAKGAGHNQCVREKCCGRTDPESTAKWQRSLIKRAISGPEKVSSVKKRGIRDQVARCMQSNCSGLAAPHRHFCNYVHCERAA